MRSSRNTAAGLWHKKCIVVLCNHRRDHIDGVRRPIHWASSPIITRHDWWMMETAHCFARAADAINWVPTDYPFVSSKPPTVEGLTPRTPTAFFIPRMRLGLPYYILLRAPHAGSRHIIYSRVVVNALKCGSGSLFFRAFTIKV